MALGAQMVDLVGLDLADQVRELPGDGQVAVVEVEARLGVVDVAVKVVDPVGVEGAGPPDEAVDLVAFAEQELRQV